MRWVFFGRFGCTDDPIVRETSCLCWYNECIGEGSCAGSKAFIVQCECEIRNCASWWHWKTIISTLREPAGAAGGRGRARRPPAGRVGPGVLDLERRVVRRLPPVQWDAGGAGAHRVRRRLLGAALDPDQGVGGAGVARPTVSPGPSRRARTGAGGRRSCSGGWDGHPHRCDHALRADRQRRRRPNRSARRDPGRTGAPPGDSPRLDHRADADEPALATALGDYAPRSSPGSPTACRGKPSPCGHL